jgi:hypothetical protein
MMPVSDVVLAPASDVDVAVVETSDSEMPPSTLALLAMYDTRQHARMVASTLVMTALIAERPLLGANPFGETKPRGTAIAPIIDN